MDFHGSRLSHKRAASTTLLCRHAPDEQMGARQVGRGPGQGLGQLRSNFPESPAMPGAVRQPVPRSEDLARHINTPARALCSTSSYKAIVEFASDCDFLRDAPDSAHCPDLTWQWEIQSIPRAHGNGPSAFAGRHPASSSQLTAELGFPPGLHGVASVLAGRGHERQMDTKHELEALEIAHVKHAVVKEGRDLHVQLAFPEERAQVRGEEGRDCPASTWEAPGAQQPRLPSSILKHSLGVDKLTTVLGP